jgi:hypothetical protein
MSRVKKLIKDGFQNRIGIQREINKGPCRLLII